MQPEKVTLTKPCKYCQTQFEYKRKTAEFCSDAHKKAHARQRTEKLHSKRLYRFETSAFVYFLADSCRRSGTVEVLPKMLSDIEELHKLYKYSLASNGYGHGHYADYNLCHIFPAQHPTHVGTMHANNLVVSYKDLNNKHGSKCIAGAGTKIHRVDLKSAWRVESDAKLKDVVQMIVSYLSIDYTATIAVKLKLQPSTRQAVIDWLTSSTSELVPSPIDMQDMTTQALTKLKSAITEKSSFGAPAKLGYNSADVFLHELNRLSHHRPQLSDAVDTWITGLADYIRLNDTCSRSMGKPAETMKALRAILDSVHTAQFELLHGSKVETFTTKLPKLLTEAMSILDAPTPAIPVRAVKPAPAAHKPATPVATPAPALRVVEVVTPATAEAFRNCAVKGAVSGLLWNPWDSSTTFEEATVLQDQLTAAVS